MSVAREGLPFIAGALIPTVLLALAYFRTGSNSWLVLGLASLLLLGFVTYFFRDPDRRSTDPVEVLVSPADGRIIEVAVDQEEFFAGPCRRITIFLNVFNVHVQRSPIAGTVEYRDFQEGKYLAAWNPAASRENAQSSTGIVSRYGRVMVRQIVGLVARRIVTYPEKGDVVERGDRIGIIKFGSRVDLFVPLDWEVLVEDGQKVAGGETAIVRVPSSGGSDPSGGPTPSGNQSSTPTTSGEDTP